jgi:hypothetical protein
MTSQTLLFTVMPRGVSLDAETLPVSVYVSPRLFADTPQGLLKDFPDWLSWPRLLQEQGLELVFRCNGQDFTAFANTQGLQPSVWEALFKPETLVRSHTFDDYSQRRILCPSTRAALSLLKGVYQQASVELALPRPLTRESDLPDNYHALQQLVNGLEVNWDERSYRMRYEYQHMMESRLPELKAQGLAADGTIPFERLSPADRDDLRNIRGSIAKSFISSQKIPPGTPLAEDPPDFANLLDFHQVLSSLNSYPAVLRALGLVLDVDLPRDFVALARPDTPGKLSVAAVLPRWEWAVPTTVQPLETAYLHFAVENGQTLFFTAPASTLLPPHQPPDREADEVVGLLNLHPQAFGLAQVDVDGGMHKLIMQAETVQPDRLAGPADPPYPQVLDTRAALPALRSGGFSLFADSRGRKLLKKFQDAAQLNRRFDQQQPQDKPFCAEDLVHGYRIDIWDSHTGQWHSLHRRNAVYTLEGQTFSSEDEEGFTQLAAAQPPPNKENPPPDDIYLQETIARWAGWSLSVGFPDNPLSSDPDPQKALEQQRAEQNLPVTPFNMTTDFKVVRGSLPSLRFGRRYRLRARAVDICGNSIPLDSEITRQVSASRVLPKEPEGVPYLRYEPVGAPLVVLRDPAGVTGAGSQLERLVIRTFNSEPALDGMAANLEAGDRHILPPRTSVEMAERLGMLDDTNGKLSLSPALYPLLCSKDGVELNQFVTAVAGKEQGFPLETAERLDALPYIPDVLARGAALRDLPGAPAATLVSFGGEGDWQTLLPFRLALVEGDAAPVWDADNRVLTVALPKGTAAVVPLSSYLHPDDLKLMGVWHWLREYLEAITSGTAPMPDLPRVQDAIAHILQRSVEGGHWMLTPPLVLNLVHAVQQPLGIPAFTAISVQHGGYHDQQPDPHLLQTQPEAEPTAATELNPVTAWRLLGSTDAYLLGGLQLHGASTAKVELLAEWDDPMDDPAQPEPGTIHQATPVDEVPLHQWDEHGIAVQPTNRGVGYYDPEHDVLCFLRRGDYLGNLESGERASQDFAPRHAINDTRHHRIRYTAVATSRYQEYFSPLNDDGSQRDFTRRSAPVLVNVPASTRPLAPTVAYVLPTFGWQRQTQTNLQRSVRLGGGLRVYLERPWFSSGEGELLGVSLFNGAVDLERDEQAREQWKPFITQWGHDPVWPQTGSLPWPPSRYAFQGFVAVEAGVSLEEDAGKRVEVVGYPVAFDSEQQRWYCDLTVNTGDVYTPFIRLALVRYQPHALRDAKLSRVVLADFAQLTPERALLVTADPYQPGQLRIAVSGVAPVGPLGRNPSIEVRLQERAEEDLALEAELGWQDAAPESAAFISVPGASAAVLYASNLKLNVPLLAGRYRLLITEYESFPADNGLMLVPHGRRLVYCESVLLDAALLAEPGLVR